MSPCTGWLRWCIDGMGAVVAGEAAALVLGTRTFGARPNPWNSRKNRALLGLDLVTGTVLLWLALAVGEHSRTPAFYVVVTLALLTHGYREWEYFVAPQHRFAANVPLLIMNSTKICGFALLIVGAQL